MEVRRAFSGLASGPALAVRLAHRMLGDGRSIGEIAAALGLSRNTIRRFARADRPEELLVNPSFSSHGIGNCLAGPA